MTPELRLIFCAFPTFPQDRRELRTAAGTWVVGMVVEGLIWSFCLAFGRTPPVGCCGMDSDRTLHAGAGGGCGRSSAIRRKISWNIRRGMATSAIWKAISRQWLTTFAPILMSFSLSLVSDQSLIGSGVASVRRKLPRL